MKRTTYQDRDEMAQWTVSIWRDAIAFKYTQDQVLTKMERMRQDRRYKRLPQYQREYVRGYEQSFHDNVIYRQYLEHGYWVRMPDGTEKWFGTHERVHEMNDVITHRYIYEHAIPERSGIYWVADTPRVEHRSTVTCGPGEKPYLLSPNQEVK